MIHSSRALVTLKPARQAALQAILTVEESRRRGARLPALPHARTFLRVLTGSSRINTTVAQRIPGLNWEPKNRMTSLKQVEEALDLLISSHGEYCPLPLSVDVQAELFPEVMHTRTDRRMQREKIAFNRKMRREEKALEHAWLLRQNLLGQGFWPWRTRFASLKPLDWLRDSDEPLYNVMYEIRFIVRETPAHVREAERWLVPNKLTDRSRG